MSIMRQAFNPCSINTDIYLIELNKCKGVEKFNLVSETYTTLPVAPPTIITSSAYNVLKGREMVFLSLDKQVHKWNTDTSAYSVTSFTGTLPERQLASNCPTTCMGNKVILFSRKLGR